MFISRIILYRRGSISIFSLEIREKKQSNDSFRSAFTLLSLQKRNNVKTDRELSFNCLFTLEFREKI
jgi:hypothetical protein